MGGVNRLAATLLIALFVSAQAVFLPLQADAGRSTLNADDVWQGDLVLSGNTNHTIIGETFHINGSIVITENATLYLREATLNFTQMESYQHNITLRNPAGGRPRLQAYGSSIHSGELTMYIRPYGNGSVYLDTVEGNYISILTDDQTTLNVSAAFLKEVFSEDQTVAEISDSTIGRVGAGARSSVLVRDSTAGMWVQPSSVNSTIEDLGPGFFEHWNFEENCSVTGLSFPDFTLIRTTVTRWVFRFYGASNVTLDRSIIDMMFPHHQTRLTSTDSSIDYLSVGRPSGTAELVNTTIDNLDLSVEGRVWVYWYLDVHVVDEIDQDIPMASVTAKYANDTQAGVVQTDSSGWAMLTLLDKMVNATDSYPEEAYTVTATYETHMNQDTVEMTGNRELTIALPFMIPELPLTVLTIMAVSIMGVVVLLLKRRLPSSVAKNRTAE